jgi:F-type H+-transporting ATPase subunit delta
VADDSKATDAGQRYAKALFDLAKETDQLGPVETDLKSFKAMLAQSADLRRLLSSPAFSSEDKASGLKALAEAAGIGALTRQFVGVLCSNKRTPLLGSVIASFEARLAAERGTIAAQVTTAVPLTAAQTKSLGTALRDALGKDPDIETRVDPSLLGGIKVRVGSRLFDSSLKSKLDSLKFALKRA